ARVEIEIEGPNGWAENLPTWRLRNKWTRLCFGDRPITGYHVWAILFVTLLSHLPLAMDWPRWSWHRELQVLAFVILFFVVEDFLWFVLNPAYGVRRFRREHIWWHRDTWWWVMPRDYWLFSTLGVAAYVLAGRAA